MKENTLLIVVVGLLVLVLGLGGFLILRPVIVNERVTEKTLPFGGTAGTTHYFAEQFLEEISAQLVEEGGVLTSTVAVLTLTAAQACNNNVVNQSWVGVASSTGILNLPATSTLYADCLDSNGDLVSFLYRNTESAAASTTVVTAGTGGILLEPDGQNVVINGGNAARIVVTRISNTNVTVEVDELIDAD